MNHRCCVALALLVVVTSLALPRRGQAQEPATAHAVPEVRIDAIAGDRRAIQGGVGLQIPFGFYVRLGADAALGARTGTRTGTSQSALDGRVDLLARFLLDPFRQSPYGFSAGAGLSARFEPGERVTPLLLVALELEGRRRPSGWVPALQAGLGGGARIGVVIRRAERSSR